MQPISSSTPQSISVTAVPQPPVSEAIAHLDRAIDEVAIKALTLQTALSHISNQAPDEIARQFTEVNRIVHLSSETPDPVKIEALLKAALDNVQKELARLKEEKSHLMFPLQDLSLELLGLVIEQADQKTKAELARASRPLCQATLWVTKIECATRGNELLQKLQLELPLVALHDLKATEAVIKELSHLDGNRVRAETRFTGIQQSIRALRNDIARALSHLAIEDIEAAESIVTSILLSPEYERSVIKGEISIVLSMLKAEKIPDVTERSKACRKITEELLKKNDIEGAMIFLDGKFLQDNPGTGFDKSDTINQVAVALTKRDDFEKAIMLANDVDPIIRVFFFSQVPYNMVARIGPEATSALFEKLLGPGPKELWTMGISEAMANLGDFDGAIALAETIPSPFDVTRELTYNHLAGILAKNGFIERAIALSERIMDADTKSFALSQIAIQMVIKGRVQEALSLVDCMTNNMAKDWALEFIASQMGHQNMDQANEIANRIQDAVKKADILEALARIAKGEASSDDSDSSSGEE